MHIRDNYTFELREPTLYHLSYVREAAILANRALRQRVANTRSSDARIDASRPGRSTVSAAAPVVSIALTAERIATRSRSRSSSAARASSFGALGCSRLASAVSLSSI